MAKRVSAETITEITSSPGFTPPGRHTTPPSVADIETRTRRDLDDNIAKFKQILAGDLVEDDYIRAQQSLQKAQHQRVQFEKLLTEVPEGFKLVPVLYSKITQDQNAAVHSEYLTNVRSRFLQFVGENYADEARALGICEHGIDRMKKGLDPSDATGRQYEMNIDHIVERAGSGLWANSKEKDPDQKDEVEDKFRQNHFGNLILIPEAIHEFKNTLNQLQRIGNLQPGESKWILMMTPERNDHQAGFICPPQSKGSRWEKAVQFRPDDPYRRISHAVFTVDQATDRYKEFRAMPVVDKVLMTVDEVAKRYKRPVVEMANDNIKGKRSLAKIFNDVLEHDEAAREHAEKLLYPALGETATFVRKAFDEVVANAKAPKGDKLVNHFALFYRGKNVGQLRDKAASLPVEEAKQLHDAFRAIDQELGALENKLGVLPRENRDNVRTFNDRSSKKPQNGQGQYHNGGKKNKSGQKQDNRTADERARDAYWAKKRRAKKNGQGGSSHASRH